MSRPWQASLQTPQAYSSLAVIEQQRLGFPLRVLGQAHGPIVPQRVGCWWLETEIDEAQLPSRARHRLQAVRATGLPIKAVVLFHEIQSEPRSPDARMTGLASRLGRWAEQELPSRSTRAAARARQAAPIVGSAARLVIGLTAAGLAATAAVVAALTLAALAAALTDPCLVVVTEDGSWIEIDRWLD